MFTDGETTVQRKQTKRRSVDSTDLDTFRTGWPCYRLCWATRCGYIYLPLKLLAVPWNSMAESGTRMNEACSPTSMLQHALRTG